MRHREIDTDFLWRERRKPPKKMQSPSAKASPFGEANDLLTADNEAVFFGLDKPLKAVLFSEFLSSYSSFQFILPTCLYRPC